MATSRTLPTTARRTATTGPTGLWVAYFWELAPGSTAPNTSPATSTTGLTLVTATADRFLDAEMNPTTTSTAMRPETGKATWSKAIMSPAVNTDYPVATGRSIARTRGLPQRLCLPQKFTPR